MTLRNFLKLHQDGTATRCVSIHLLPYDDEKHGYMKTYFEEADQEKLKRLSFSKKSGASRYTILILSAEVCTRWNSVFIWRGSNEQDKTEADRDPGERGRAGAD